MQKKKIQTRNEKNWTASTRELTVDRCGQEQGRRGAGKAATGVQIVAWEVNHIKSKVKWTTRCREREDVGIGEIKRNKRATRSIRTGSWSKRKKKNSKSVCGSKMYESQANQLIISRLDLCSKSVKVILASPSFAPENDQWWIVPRLRWRGCVLAKVQWNAIRPPMVDWNGVEKTEKKSKGLELMLCGQKQIWLGLSVQRRWKTAKIEWQRAQTQQMKRTEIKRN